MINRLSNESFNDRLKVHFYTVVKNPNIPHTYTHTPTTIIKFANVIYKMNSNELNTP